MMTPEQIRLKQNPILTSLLLGLGQGTFIAERLFPRLPQVLSSVQLAQMGDERLRRYNLRRAPGAATKRVNIKYEGRTYTVDQYAVDVPIPRELLREADESRKLQVGNYLDISRIAMVTANEILALDYEAEVAQLATNPDSYASGHVLALSGGTKWSADTGTPVTDIRAAADTIRKKIGKRPNHLALSADALQAITLNKEVKSYLSNTQTGPATLEQLKTILNVAEIVVGDAVWIDDSDTGRDVWGNNAVLAYVPRIGGNGADISLAEPGFGFTNVIEGHPFAETPYYENGSKSWIYGATYERRPNIAYNGAAFLFTNTK
ncbi:major capsid protein [Giesbergeria anulus]|uniref:Phage major capsid protein E n=1 Tax=Giesbergeria anulus TaxID=180197 RepID=A0A1H9JDJ0_9BURK|nr:major capsid protein [Giesbergeria anulus]SEQ84896.1 Phage major capsid protein E [Giesbergeria anulus]